MKRGEQIALANAVYALGVGLDPRGTFAYRAAIRGVATPDELRFLANIPAVVDFCASVRAAAVFPLESNERVLEEGRNENGTYEVEQIGNGFVGRVTFIQPSSGAGVRFSEVFAQRETAGRWATEFLGRGIPKEVA